MENTDTTHDSNRTEFEHGVLQFLPNVARYARLLTENAADAEDLTQETFLRAYQHWNTFELGTDCRRWLFTICRNVHLRNRQRSKRFIEVDDPDAESFAVRAAYDDAYSNGIGRLFDRIDLAPAIERGIRELQPEYQEVILLVDIEDRTYADAAVQAGIPVGTIRSRLFRARRLLQESLLEHARDRGWAERAPSSDSPAPREGAA